MMMKVKPLVWDGFCAGPYWIEVETGGIAHLFCDYDRSDEGVEPIKGGYLTLVSIDDLKAAAQADYEARIMAALEPDTDLSAALIKAALERAAMVADDAVKQRSDQIDSQKHVDHVQRERWRVGRLQARIIASSTRALSNDPSEIDSIIKQVMGE